jgi:hypothetical protein
MSTVLKFTPGMNYLFHGLNEHFYRDTVKSFTEKQSDVRFFWWTTPDFDKSSLNIQADTGQKKSIKDSLNESDLNTFLVNNEGARYVVLDAVHIMAHADTSPNKYYKELLAICNFHTLTNKIYFILSCARVPVVFHKENSLRHLWEFHPCQNHDDINDESPQNRYCLHKFVGDLQSTPSPQVFDKIEKRFILKSGKGEKYPEINEKNAATLDSGLSDVVQGVSESFSLFDSADIYFQENRSPVLSHSIRTKVGKLANVIVGQEEAVQSLIDRILISCNPADPDSIRNETKPRGVFLFVGPSGVGKTKISQELANVLPDYKFLQINLAEYQDGDSVNKLIGIGRGYVDSDQGGILTEPVRFHSKYVLLFDELDQAHKFVGQLFYKIFEGKVTDGRGRQISFRDCYIIMTSNKGVLAESSRLPPVERSLLIQEELKKGSTDSDKLVFTDAFLGRIGDTIPFRPLSVQNLAEVAEKYFNAEIREPYKKIPITKFAFVLDGLASTDSLADPHPLITHGILNPESLFFEKWALFAGHENPQGARQLFRIMDDYLIRPLELARIKCPGEQPITEISFRFKPVMLDTLNFEQATIAVIDDKPEEVSYIKEIFSDPWWNVIITDFNVLGPVKNAQVILLDIFNDGHDGMISVDATIEEIRKVNPIAPIILHSSLSTGPLRQSLKNEQWRSGVFGYLSKEDHSHKKDIEDLVSKAVRAYHSSAKKRIKLTRFTVKPPKSYQNSPLIFDYTYEQAY